MRASAAVLTLMLVGLSGAALAAPDCHPPIDPMVPQYIVGYGSLMLADHRGIFGLGLFLTLGTTASLVAALVVLPILLQLFGSHPGRRPTPTPSPATATPTT